MYTSLRLWDGYRNTTALNYEVSVLQKLLKIPVDGFFGRGTEEAVLNFQREHNLSVTGVVDVATWEALGVPIKNTKYETTISIEDRNCMQILDAYNKYASIVQQLVEQMTTGTPITQAIIFGIGARESRWGLALKPACPYGTGDFAPRATPLPPDGLGWGRGLMQIDYAAHEFARTGNWKNPVENIRYGISVLLAEYNSLRDIRQALAAYNCGRANVRRTLARRVDVDYYTSGRDYSKGVLNYVGWYELYA